MVISLNQGKKVLEAIVLFLNKKGTATMEDLTSLGMESSEVLRVVTRNTKLLKYTFRRPRGKSRIWVIVGIRSDASEFWDEEIRKSGLEIVQ